MCQGQRCPGCPPSLCQASCSIPVSLQDSLVREATPLLSVTYKGPGDLLPGHQHYVLPWVKIRRLDVTCLLSVCNVAYSLPSLCIKKYNLNILSKKEYIYIYPHTQPNHFCCTPETQHCKLTIINKIHIYISVDKKK